MTEKKGFTAKVFTLALTQPVEQDRVQRVGLEKYLALQRDNPNNSAVAGDTKERQGNLTHWKR